MKRHRPNEFREFENCCVVMAMKSLKLALCVRILQDTCQAASCDALAQNDANVQLDYEILCAEDVGNEQTAKQEGAARIQRRRHHSKNCLSNQLVGSSDVPPQVSRE